MTVKLAAGNERIKDLPHKRGKFMSRNGLATVEEISRLIVDGRVLLLSGDEGLLSKLPSGKWIGGTTINFMTSGGEKTDDRHIFYTDMSEYHPTVEIHSFSKEELGGIGRNYPAHGFTVLIVPCFSEIHATFSREFHCYGHYDSSPLIGWISGVKVSQIGKLSPKTFAGCGSPQENKAAVMYVTLPEGLMAKLNIINLFTQGVGPVIVFDENEFSASGACLIDGKRKNLAEYITENHLDTRLPLVSDCDFDKINVNVSIQSVDANKGLVRFYSPVFSYIKYRFAAPVPDYTEKFRQAVTKVNAGNVAFSCNCLYNFLNDESEGKSTAPFVGAYTFGEIGSVPLNQTLVYISIEKRSGPVNYRLDSGD